ncbi:MAG: sigma-70 family RNA polymerase sigma factor [Actinomycetota bacterium]
MLAQVGPIDEDGYAALHQHYWAFLVGLATKRGARDPEGLASATLIEGLAALDRLEKRNEFSFQLYLRRILTAKVAREYRTGCREHLEAADGDGALPDPSESTVDGMWLHDLIEQLSPDQQAVIRGRFFEDLSAKELGRKLGKDPNAIYQLQHRAIVSLRRAVFVGLALALVAIGLVTIRQVTQAQIETTPIDRPDETDPTPDVSSPTPTSLRRADSERLSPGLDDQGRQLLVGPDSEAPGPTTSAAEEPGSAGPAPAPTESSNSTTTSTAVPAAPPGTNAPTTADLATTTSPPPQDPPPLAPTPPATICVVTPDQLRVFVAGGADPDSYEFLDAGGNLVFTASLAQALVAGDMIAFDYSSPFVAGVRLTVDGMAPSVVTDCVDRTRAISPRR